MTARDLKIGEADLEATVAGLRLTDSIEGSIDFFATLAWNVICEPGDGFAGQLIETIGPAEALRCEIERIPAVSYLKKFTEVGSNFVESQDAGAFEETLHQARERWSARLSMQKVREAAAKMQSQDAWFITSESRH